ncbi:MAG: hypothetical protein DRQ37_04595, partial [Gammaproteobacteria bacterium]
MPAPGFAIVTGAAQVFRSLSLTIKATALLLVMGAVIWSVLSYFQARDTKAALRTHLAEELARRAHDDRRAFDEALEEHRHSAMLMISLRVFQEYIERLDSRGWEAGSPKVFSSSPPWLARRFLRREFRNSRYLLLFDDLGRVRQIFNNGFSPLREQFVDSASELMRQSLQRSFITDAGKTPMLLAAESISDANGSTRAYLMLATPIDTDFLMNAHGISVTGDIVAVRDANTNEILATSRPDLLSEGVFIGDQAERFMVVGQSFFEYGALDIPLQLISLQETADVETLASRMAAEARQDLALYALAFGGAFALIVLWIARRLNLFTHSIVRMAENKGKGKDDSDIVPPDGDEIAVLQNAFDKLMRELDTQQRALLHSSKLASIGELAAGVAHEINNPLNVLSLLISEQLRRIPDNDRRDTSVRRMLEKMLDAVERIASIVEGLRTYARTDTAESTNVDLHKVVNSSLSLVKAIYSKENITFDVQLKADKSTVFGQEGKLNQVLMNYLTNAHDALEGRLNGRILVETENDDDLIRLRIVDNGCGMSEEIAARMFDAFFTTKPPGQGTGLGMGIAHSIIDDMDGTIEVSSHEGRGSTVITALPLSTGDLPLLELCADGADFEVLPLRLMIVDDEPDLRELLGGAMARYTEGVTVVDGGAQALIRLREQAYDVVITDLKM